MTAFPILIQLLTFVIVVIGLLNWKAIKQVKLEWLIILQGISFVTEIISHFTIIYYQNNLLTYNFFALFQTLIVLLLIGSWNSPSIFANLIRLLSAAYFLFWMYENFILNTIWLKTCNWSMLIGALMTVVIIAIYLIRLSNTNVTPIVRSPRFWVAASYLIYASGSSIFLSINENLIDSIRIDKTFPINFYLIHYALHTFASILLIKAILCLPKRPSPLFSSSS